MDCLKNTRTPAYSCSIKQKLFFALLALLGGIVLGVLSKYLDYHQSELPALLQAIDRTLDFHNFLGGVAPWVLIAVCISVYSLKPTQAAANVFLFFVGMVSSYYLYSKFVAGFFPRNYALIWVAITVVTPLLAYFCWYAKGTGLIALILSAGIIGVLINTAISFGVFYVYVRSWLNLILLIVAIIVLRKSVKETVIMICVGTIVAVILDVVIPFNIP